jgi:hypothetical protein
MLRSNRACSTALPLLYLCVCHAAGTPEQVKRELARLDAILKNVTSEAHAAAAAEVQPAAEDWGGRLLRQLHVWRRQRIAALERELRRINNLVLQVE